MLVVVVGLKADAIRVQARFIKDTELARTVTMRTVLLSQEEEKRAPRGKRLVVRVLVYF
jgi:hypothetical protein